MIPFTQFKLPHGERSETSIDRPAEIEGLARELISVGFVFEIEILRTGEISMDCSNRNGLTLDHRLCSNGPEVPATVDNLVKNSHKAWVNNGKQPANKS